MWIPQSEEEIINVVQSGSLEESPAFDAKRELPSKTKNFELAQDVAAMAVDGGVLLYGIGEDEHKRPTVLNPIPLAGQAERIDSIVRTSIAEPPFIRVSTIPTADDPSIGYIVVVIPPSERAPHMVIVKDEYRYYSRADKGNRPLTEAEVARLYERRRRTEVDREALLNEAVGRWTYPRHSALAYLYLIARPTLGDEQLLQRSIREDGNIPTVLHNLVGTVRTRDVFPVECHPDFHQPNWRFQPEGYLGRMGYHGDMEVSSQDELSVTLDLQVDLDGTGCLFAGGAGDRLTNGALVLYPLFVAGWTTRFLTLLGLLYERARYFGTADVAVVIVGMQGRTLDLNYRQLRAVAAPYDRDEYRRTARTSALGLRDEPREVAKSLLMPFFNAMSQGTIDPFS